MATRKTETFAHPRGELRSDWEIVQALLTLCGIEFVAENDRSTYHPNPFWIRSPWSSEGPHWHIMFSPDGECVKARKEDEPHMAIGRPCSFCTHATGR